MSYPPHRRLRLIVPGLLCLAAIGYFRLRPRAQGTPSNVVFANVTQQAGIHYRFVIPDRPASSQTSYTILQTIGNGCGFLDYDGDGNLDILLVGTKLALYRGDGHGHFTDVTHETGLDTLSGHFLGCAVGDYDNDGHDDLYISGYRTGLLLHNESGSRTSPRPSSVSGVSNEEGRGSETRQKVEGAGRVFRDVTQQAGLKPQPWGTSCGFADLDGDGKLDLLIANYVQFGSNDRRYKQICIPVSCSPESYDPEKPTLYHNLGNGRFADVSQESGIRTAAGKGLAVGFADYDDDGRPDMMIANDLTPGDLLHNEGHLRFRNVGVESGTALGPTGVPHGGMGVDWADYDGDGRLDAFVTTFVNEPKSLYHNDGQGLFTDTATATGINPTATPSVAFGAKWLDYDNDGWPDLLVANGHIYNNIARIDRVNPYRQRLQAFHNSGAGQGAAVTFTDESGLLGPDFQQPIVGRGLATGDFDNDGRVDVLVVDSEGPPLLLHNQGGRAGHWIGLSLVGAGHSNRNALGARVEVDAGGRRQIREVQTAGSYLSSSDRRLLFGLGAAARVDKITIRWPDGLRQVVTGLETGAYHEITEGRPTPTSP